MYLDVIKIVIIDFMVLLIFLQKGSENLRRYCQFISTSVGSGINSDMCCRKLSFKVTTLWGQKSDEFSFTS